MIGIYWQETVLFQLQAQCCKKKRCSLQIRSMGHADFKISLVSKIQGEAQRQTASRE